MDEISFNNSHSTCANIPFVDGSDKESEFKVIVNGYQGYILWGILFVILTVLGTIGNIITIIVLKRDTMTILNILLIALTVSDILAPQANALIAFSYYHLSEIYSNSVVYLKLFDYLRYLIQPLSTMFTMSSSWILTTTTLFRLIAVISPFKSRSIITRKLTFFTLFTIYTFSFVSIIPIYLSLISTSKCTEDGKMEYDSIEMGRYIFIIEVYTPGMQVMCFYLPWFTALILWICLIRSLKNHNREVQYSLSETNDSRRNSRNDSRRKKFLSKGSSRGSLNTCPEVAIKKSEFYPLSSRIQSKNHRSTLNDEHQKGKRSRNANKITITVIVLCFSNLISRTFTLSLIFEAIFNQYQVIKRKEFVEKYDTKQLMDASLDIHLYDELKHMFQTAKSRYPRFLAYSLLFNNIFLCLNHACNILIYTFTNPRFKKNLKNLFNLR